MIVKPLKVDDWLLISLDSFSGQCSRCHLCVQGTFQLLTRRDQKKNTDILESCLLLIDPPHQTSFSGCSYGRNKERTVIFSELEINEA